LKHLDGPGVVLSPACYCLQAVEGDVAEPQAVAAAAAALVAQAGCFSSTAAAGAAGAMLQS